MNAPMQPRNPWRRCISLETVVLTVTVAVLLVTHQNPAGTAGWIVIEAYRALQRP